MQPAQNYSLLHVVNHLKYCLKHNDPKYQLTLEYKLAKIAENVEGNKKFQQFLKDSHEMIVVMNANREKKRNDYVHLKAGAGFKDFDNFQANISMLNNIHKTQSSISQKVDLNFMGQKISFDSQTLKWSYKSKRLLFRSNYETIKNGKLFRISLLSQGKGDKEPRRKVVQMLEQAVSKTLEGEKTSGWDKICGSSNKLEEKIIETTQKKVVQQKKQETSKQHKGPQPALRFKTQQKIHLNPYFTLILSQVYQSINIKLYKSILQLVETKKNSHNDIIGKLLLSEMVKEIFQDLKQDLHYEVEMRFGCEFLKEMENKDEEDLYHVMELAAEVFVGLGKEKNEFCPEEVVKVLEIISKR